MRTRFVMYPWGKSVKSVTGHASDKSIESYSARPTTEQQSESSAIVSRFVTKRNPDQPSLVAALPRAISSLAAKSSTTIQQRNQEVYQLSIFYVNPSSAPDFAHSVFLFQSSQWQLKWSDFSWLRILSCQVFEQHVKNVNQKRQVFEFFI